MKNIQDQKEEVQSSLNGKSSKRAWAEPVDSVLKLLRVEPDKGLSADEVAKRREKYGPNQLRKHRKKNLLEILKDQLKSLIILLLAVAAAVSFLYGEFLEGWAILVVIFINTGIGFFTELKAVRSMEALFELGRVTNRVRREGTVREVDAEALVPGDIIVIEGGDVITADIRLIESSRMQANESTLTGESMPVSKSVEAVPEETVLAERSSMLYKGTAVTRGSGLGVVLKTGADTELGQISTLVEEAEEEHTPLEERLDNLGYRLIVLTLVIACVVTVAGIIRGKEILLMIETGIALAVASIPEGLPIVATIALAKGMRIMARKNALINRLSSVETLGTTGIIFTDKTGTLTENKMTVTHFLLPGKDIEIIAEGTENFRDQEENASVNPKDDPALKRSLETAVFCNNASLHSDDGEDGTGDPLEVALLAAAAKAGQYFTPLREKYPEKKEEAFDAEVKMMATWNAMEAGLYRVSVKGAPGSVLDACTTEYVDGEQQDLDQKKKDQWLALNDEYAAKGHRMIALAYKEENTTESKPYENLTFLGLVALLDPPREDVKPAIEECRKAGIRVIMVTGDQQETARFIADSVGLADTENGGVVHGKDMPALEETVNSATDHSNILASNIFARISPRQKLDLIELYQKKGYVVAMTGDGVNDAPALKKANIGIAMGQRGTQVAKEAADMVLTDDAFSTIVAAIEQGRIIFGNIRRFIFYLLSCNVSEVLVVGLATIAGAPLPLLPLQILFLNLVTDVFPALALGVGEGEEGVMQQPPRTADTPIITNKYWLGIGIYGLIITGSVMGALYLAMHVLQLSQMGAVTISFLTLAFAQLWHVFNMRSGASGWLDNTIVKNKWVWGALALCVMITLAAVYIPPIAVVLKVTAPGLSGWIVVMGMSSIPYFSGQIYKVLFETKL